MVIQISDDIFTSIEHSKTFLTETGILAPTKTCIKCGSITKLVVYRKNDDETLIYRCSRKGCQSKRGIFNTKLSIPKALQVIYLMFADVNYHQLYLFIGIADSTISRFKTKLDGIFERYLRERPVLLGGPNCVIEVDETVLSRRGVIRNPTSHDVINQDTVWILGCVDRNNGNFFIKRILNRQINTITETLEGVVSVGSILFSDGYPSYPRVAENLSLEHHVVNHTTGFVAEDGTNTNSIECFWSHMKSSMRKENGVKRVNVDKWLMRYTFKRRYIINSSREEFSELYIQILKYWFD